MNSHFVGRGAELAVLSGRFRTASGGDPQVVLVEGEPGMGKTSLVERFLATAGGAVVLRASGDEDETLLTYGIAAQLAHAAGAAGAEMLGRLASAAADEHLAIGTCFMGLIGAGQDAGPVVLVIDDVQWADVPSLRVLTFALRRLVADRVLAVLVARADATAALPDGLLRVVRGHRGTTIHLGGLAQDELGELAHRMGIDGFSARDARCLHEGTAGHPLFARAVLDELPAGGWANRRALPAPRSFRTLVHQRTARCTPAARDLIDAAAVLGTSCSIEMAALLAGVEDPIAALRSATECDLLQITDPGQPQSVAFTHPLVRAAAYEAIPPVRRLELHSSAARLLSDPGAVLRHRIAATPTTDEGLARDLAEAAESEATAGGWPGAAAHLVDAGRLSPAVEDQQARLMQAVCLMLMGGEVHRAARWEEEIRSFPPGPRRDSTLGHLATVTRGPNTAEPILEGAWAGSHTRAEPELAAVIALQNAIHWHGRLHGAATARWSERAIERADTHRSTRFVAEAHRAFGLGYAGQVVEALASVAEPSGTGPINELQQVQHGAARGWLHLVAEDLDAARSHLSATASAAARLGILNTAAFCYAHLVRADFQAGDWDEAVLHADKAMALGAESDSSLLHSLVYGEAVAVPLARGQWDLAQTYAARARAAPDAYPRAIVAGALASSRVAAAREDPARVIDLLAPIVDLADRGDLDEPGIWPWQALWAEALALTGRAPEADRFLVAPERAARRRGRLFAAARLARARGAVEAALGRADGADRAFEEAAGLLADRTRPFEQGLTALAHGRHLRRIGRRSRAAALLGAARERFELLEATPLLDRCEHELGLCGPGAIVAQRKRWRIALTPQEGAVARLVAAGLTNKEVAAELVVTVKTVEYHLGNVYAKLGGITRRQLPERLDALTRSGASAETVPS